MAFSKTIDYDSESKIKNSFLFRRKKKSKLFSFLFRNRHFFFLNWQEKEKNKKNNLKCDVFFNNLYTKFDVLIEKKMKNVKELRKSSDDKLNENDSKANFVSIQVLISFFKI